MTSLMRPASVCLWDGGLTACDPLASPASLPVSFSVGVFEFVPASEPFSVAAPSLPASASCPAETPSPTPTPMNSFGVETAALSGTDSITGPALSTGIEDRCKDCFLAYRVDVVFDKVTDAPPPNLSHPCLLLPMLLGMNILT